MRFEILHKDAMGRIGRLKTPSGVVETPALMPVINPNIDFIPVKDLKRIGAEIVITNSYIIYRSRDLREVAESKGVHRLINSDLPVMTDSGSYQLMVYGDVEVDNRTIIEFQNRIKSDIVVPLDIPSLPDIDREKAERDLEITLKREKEAIDLHSEIGDDRLISAPIQGSTYLDLRRKSAEECSKLNADFYPIGGVVPLLDAYRFQDVVRIILEVKSALPPSAPVHLFGAGHPMVFAMAVALGCDFFDSAAYALYAKDGRYLTVNGTKKLEELQYFPCKCPVCSDYTPREVKSMEKRDREILLGKHNLYVCFEEINTIKQAIRENNLFELVETRVRSHPYLLSGWRVVRDYIDLMEKYDPVSKQGFFYTGIESIYRPAVVRHERRIMNIEIDKKEVLISSDKNERADFYLVPVFGLSFAENYPSGHAEFPDEEYIEDEAIVKALDILYRFAEQNRDVKFRLNVSDRWKEVMKSRNPPENIILLE
ncbi:archaeosine tRNA-ribosyltransferase [Archaeoglobus sulfaticallidus PM70-1]|uniref:tRNA-guanine(15) transglycosylase n=1 Tax=Archaeoglobus sulfaticallidus PM70-1 TaxID=387631 RepID=N0BD80_9EURY|nr:tRNA guanosine(15) transglycosylase TgtA [Archaeoglobus sulfaticallidus]AGK60202.1 archaeosine tRNA-ribosyltransferase [Archaeoglobus sulfaticallidus PM70-1]